MPWVRIDDSLHDHPKLYRLPASMRLHCLGAWALSICYASFHLTDGEVPTEWLRAKGAQPRHIAALVDAGFFDAPDGEGTVWVHDFLDYNPSREQVEERRSETREARIAAGRIGGKRSGEARAKTKQTGSKDEANGKHDDEAIASTRAKQTRSPVPSRPLPVAAASSTEALGTRARPLGVVPGMTERTGVVPIADVLGRLAIRSSGDGS